MVEKRLVASPAVREQPVSQEQLGLSPTDQILEEMREYVELPKGDLNELHERFITDPHQESVIIPWLEPRIPPNLSVPTCFHGHKPLHTQFTREDLSERNYEAACLPHVPNPEQLQATPEWQPQSELDDYVLQLLTELGATPLLFDDHSQNLNLPDSYKSKLRSQSPEEFALRYASWAASTAIEGADYLTAENKTRNVAQWLTRTFSIAGPPKESYVYLPMPRDIFGKWNEWRSNLTSHRSKLIDVEYPYLQTDFLRWDESQGKTYSLPEALGEDALEKSYRDLLLSLKLTETNTFTHIILQNYANLVMGGRLNLYGGDQNLFDLNYLDYFDAFMLVSQEMELMDHLGDYYLDPLIVKEQARNLLHSPTGEIKHCPTQWLALLLTLYLRMPQRQKECYSRIIKKVLEKASTKLPDSLTEDTSEPPLYCETSLHPRPHLMYDSYSYTSKGEDPARIARLLHAQFSEHILTHASKNSHFLETVANADQTIGQVYLSRHLDIIGYNSYQYTINPETGELTHQDYQAKPKRELSKRESSHEALQALGLPDFSPAVRLGQEADQTMVELLKENPENGSVKTVASLVTMLEKILGRPLNTHGSDLLGLVDKLGLFTDTQLDLDKLNEAELKDIVKEIKSGETGQQPLNETTFLLLMFALTGQIPRKIFVEAMFKSFDSAEKLFSLELVWTLEHLDKKKFSFFGLRKETESKLFKGKTELKALKDRLRAKHGAEYQVTADPEYQELAKHWIEQVLALYGTNHSYDLSMGSSLLSLVNAKETGELKALCQVDGIVMSSLLKLLDPELAPYFASTYGPEQKLDIDSWFELLKHTGESGTASHGFCQVSWPKPEGQALAGITIADGTGHFTQHLSEEQVTTDEEATTLLTYGEQFKLKRLPFSDSQDAVLGYCIRGGSPLLADLALSIDQLSYAELANPDFHSVLLIIAASEEFSTEKRWQALAKQLQIEPYFCAMFDPAHDRVSSVVDYLRKLVNLALEKEEYVVALFLTNILIANKHIPESAQLVADKVKTNCINVLATQDHDTLQQLLLDHTDLVTQADTQLIFAAHAEFMEQQKKLAELHSDPAELESAISKAISDTIQKAEASNHVSDGQLQSLATYLFSEEQRDRATGKTPVSAGDTAQEKYEQDTNPVINATEARISDGKGTGLGFEAIAESERRASLELFLENVPPETIPQVLAGLQLFTLKAAEDYCPGDRKQIATLMQGFEKTVVDAGHQLPCPTAHLLRDPQAVRDLAQQANISFLPEGAVNRLALPEFITATLAAKQKPAKETRFAYHKRVGQSLIDKARNLLS